MHLGSYHLASAIINETEHLISNTPYVIKSDQGDEKSGTDQGFTVFGDANLHRALWSQLSSLLKEGKIISDRLRALLYMDDVITGVRESSKDLSLPETVKALKAKVFAAFERRTGIMVDLTK